MQERRVQCNDPSTGKQLPDSSCEGRKSARGEGSGDNDSTLVAILTYIPTGKDHEST